MSTMKELVTKEQGSVLAFVLMFGFMILLLITSSLPVLFQHRQILLMREGQILANQLVFNGVEKLKTYSDCNDAKERLTSPLYYNNGVTHIELEPCNGTKIVAYIRGETYNQYVQSYVVVLNGQKVTFVKKQVGGP
jgi:hypothetical protein